MAVALDQRGRADLVVSNKSGSPQVPPHLKRVFVDGEGVCPAGDFRQAPPLARELDYTERRWFMQWRCN